MPRPLSAKYRARPARNGRPRPQTASEAPPPFFASVLGGLMGFREDSFSSNPDGHLHHSRTWGAYLARLLRYAVYWAHYEGNVYRTTIHPWSATLKENYELYTSIRSIFSPAHRIVEFWSKHIFGGTLDPTAGDGVDVASAIPILTDNPALRGAIAAVWGSSNWHSDKDDWVKMGTVLGDAPLAVVDDEARQQVYLKPLHPRILQHVDMDARGNVKGYRFQERRLDPRVTDPLLWGIEVTYLEVCTKVGEMVRFQTYLDNEPYDWHDYPDPDVPGAGLKWDWTEDYGFVPLVLVRHQSTPGSQWGMSEIHASLSRMYELDDQASKLSDQIRKLVDAPWLFCGVSSAESLQIVYPNDGEHGSESKSVRTGIPSLYATDPGAKAVPLVAPLPISEASSHIQNIIKEIERNHPELGADSDSVSGEASGRARRVAREKVEAMVVSRRANYDDGLRRALMMAISIAAKKRYPGYEAFTEESYDNDELAFSIGDRPVFAVDTLDHLEETQARALALQTLTTGGVPLEIAAILVGFPAETVQQMMQVNELHRQQVTQEADRQKAVDTAHQQTVAATGAMAKVAATVGVTIPPEAMPDVNDFLKDPQRVGPASDPSGFLEAGFSVLGLQSGAVSISDDHEIAQNVGDV